MIVICLSDVMDCFHGFLRSVMLNIHPGVYVSVDLDAGSRERVWSILESWWYAEPGGMALMMWQDKTKPMEIDFRVLGYCEAVDCRIRWPLRGRKMSLENTTSIWVDNGLFSGS